MGDYILEKTQFQQIQIISSWLVKQCSGPISQMIHELITQISWKILLYMITVAQLASLKC